MVLEGYVRARRGEKMVQDWYGIVQKDMPGIWKGMAGSGDWYHGLGKQRSGYKGADGIRW